MLKGFEKNQQMPEYKWLFSKNLVTLTQLLQQNEQDEVSYYPNPESNCVFKV